ncbi:MAG: glycosyltransferase family 4 protein [Ruminococcus sp.]|nr:glycosyltransferase family 4 protein [Ruminococcus sp.]
MVKNVVLVYDQAYISGGAAKIAVGEALGLKEQGLNVYYFSAIAPICDELKKSDIQVICLNEKHIGLSKDPSALLKALWNRTAYKQLLELLKELNPEETVVHIHGWTKALSSSVFYAAKRASIRTFVTLHEYFTICPNGGLYNYKKKEICALKPCSFKCYICNCDKRNYINKLYRVVRQLIQNMAFKDTKPEIIYITEFSKNIIKKSINPSLKEHFLTNHVEVGFHDRVKVENNKAFLYIGRLTDEKGIDIYCEAIDKTGVQGIVIGDGPLLNDFKSRYKNISFVGWKSTEEMRDYLSMARTLIVSSKWYETMGLTVIEMQQYGIPCIVPDNCACSEYVKDKYSGLIYSIGNVDSLCSCINYAADDLNLERLSKNFLAEFNPENYCLDTHINRLVEIYSMDK